MTPEHEKHLMRILIEQRKLTDAKYKHGLATHGGALWELTAIQLVEEALAESIDGTVYLLTLRDKMLAGEVAK
jgi:hypothetical protein